MYRKNQTNLKFAKGKYLLSEPAFGFRIIPKNGHALGIDSAVVKKLLSQDRKEGNTFHEIGLSRVYHINLYDHITTPVDAETLRDNATFQTFRTSDFFKTVQAAQEYAEETGGVVLTEYDRADLMHDSRKHAFFYAKGNRVGTIKTDDYTLGVRPTGTFVVVTEYRKYLNGSPKR